MSVSTMSVYIVLISIIGEVELVVATELSLDLCWSNCALLLYRIGAIYSLSELIIHFFITPCH